MSIYIVAKSLKGEGSPCWELVFFGKQATSETMRQYRQAFPNYRVWQFSKEEWDALPYGQQSADWVVIDNNHIPRWEDHVRRW